MTWALVIFLATQDPTDRVIVPMPSRKACYQAIRRIAVPKAIEDRVLFVCRRFDGKTGEVKER